MTKTAAIVAVVNAALGLLLAFGIDVSQAQEAAVLAGVNALLVLIAVIRDPNVPFGKNKDKGQ